MLMTTYKLVDNLTFTKTTIESGRGLNAPNEGSICQVIINFLSSPTDEGLVEHLYDDLLPLNIEKSLSVGFYSSVIGNYVHKCLITMKQNEFSHVSFDFRISNDKTSSIVISIRLISFERYAEIYSMSMNDLYTFALKHKENANKFFQEKNYFQAFRLYHRSLCYLLNFVDEEPTDEHLQRSNQLALTIYSNMAACQLIVGNDSGVIENCSSALQIDSTFAKAFYRRACAHANRNDFELALNDLQLAAKFEPNDRKIDDLTKQTKQRFEQYKKTMSNSLKNLF